MDTSFTGLCNKVAIVTNRPDMLSVASGGTGDIPLAVQASTLKMHTDEGAFFFKDIVTAQVKFDQAAWIQVLDTSSFARYRAMSYFRKNDPSLASYQLNPGLLPPLTTGFFGIPYTILQAMLPLQCIEPNNILDEFGVERQDVFYQAGASLFIKSSTSLNYGLMGWYAYPNVGSDDIGTGYSSWIANEYPFAIIYDAASAILQGVGMTDAARKFDNPQNGLVTSHMMALRNSNIIARGY